MREFTVYAPAKLNLYLDVLKKRPDGYHDIKTLFEKIDLKDEIIIREKGNGIDVKVEPSSSKCPSGKDNIVYRALEALFNVINVRKLGLEIIIKKRIPVSGGLGGGSSDAASIVRAVNEEFGLGASFEQLSSLVAEIGKDIPFFMQDVPFAIGMGAGELLEPIDIKACFTHIILKSDISISTGEMYKRLDKYSHRSKKPDIREVVWALKKQDPVLLRKTSYNIFEDVLADYSHSIEKAKILLSKAGAGPGFLSGTGSAVFGTVKDGEEAIEILEKIPKEEGMSIFLAATYKGGIYGDK